MTLRIGSVPYLNAKPLVDWFHSEECDIDVDMTYAVPSRLAEMLRSGDIDVANCSIFESFQNQDLRLVPGISISAYGPVKSVRLFSNVSFDQIQSVALDTSSLTSNALCRILLKEQFNISPTYQNHVPILEEMLSICEAGLIIGDLKLFDLHAQTLVYDLGAGWKELTGLPFVFAGWLAREERLTPEMADALTKAKAWGVARFETLAEKWSNRMDLPLDRCRDYLLNVMNYDLTPDQLSGLSLFKQKCFEHGLLNPLPDMR